MWTLNLGDELDIVNKKEDAEVVLTMRQNDFLKVVNGELNPQLAILGKKIKIIGDTKRGVLFQSLLAPAE